MEIEKKGVCQRREGGGGVRNRVRNGGIWLCRPRESELQICSQPDDRTGGKKEA